MMLKLPLVLLLTALIAGTALRLNGITWGLPDGVHDSYSYHPDEASLLGWARDLYRGEIVPKQFMYGGTFHASTLQASSRLADALTKGRDASLREQLLVARCFSVLCAVLAMVLVYVAGATLHGPAVGAWACLILALAPGHIVAAQSVRPDALFTLLMALNFWFAVRLLRGRGRPMVNLCCAGAALGVAVATRFPAGLWWLGHVACLVMVARAQGAGAGMALKSVTQLSAVAVLAYVIASPHSLIYYPVLLDGLATQFAYQRGGPVEGLATDVGGWRYGAGIAAQAVGFGFYVPVLAALVLALWRRRPADALLASFALPYFLLLTTTHWAVVRYFVPLLPLLAIGCGRLIDAGLKAASLPRAMTIAMLVCALTVNGLAVLVYGAALRVPDTRDQALRWLLANAPAGTAIGVLQSYPGDVFFHPPAIAHFRWSACVLSQCDVARFLDASLDMLVIADIYLDQVSVDGRRSRVAQALAEQTAFEPVRRFAASLVWHGYDLRPQFSIGDLRDALTGLTVYRRRSPSAGTATRQR